MPTIEELRKTRVEKLKKLEKIFIRNTSILRGMDKRRIGSVKITLNFHIVNLNNNLKYEITIW